MQATQRQSQRERVRRAFAADRLVHLTHRNCLDGMSCVGLLRRAFPDAEWIGIQPGQSAEALEWIADGVQEAPRRARLVVTDLSLQGDATRSMDRLSRIARRADVAWFDHHAPQWAPAAESGMRALGVHVAIDHTQTECAASLLLDWLKGLPAKPHGELRLASDPFKPEDTDMMRSVAYRDTWSDPDDPVGIRLGLASARLRGDYPLLVEHGQYRALLLLAAGPMKRRRRELEESVGRIRRLGHHVHAVWGRAPLSDLAQGHWRRHPESRLLLHFTRDGRLRVRSHPHHPIAHQLAGRFGGGGHAHAAGATLHASKARAAIARLLGRSDPKVHKAIAEARRLADASVAALPRMPPGRRPPRPAGGGRQAHGAREAFRDPELPAETAPRGP